MDHVSHSGQIRNTFAQSCYGDHFGPFWSILVHFGAPHGQPHHPSPSNFYEVIKDKYHTHQELWNATSPTLLAQFVQEILIKHGQFPLVKMDKSYHHLPCRKKSIFLKKRWGKYFIGAGSWLTRMPTKKKWGETVSDKPNNLAVPWVACKGKSRFS